MKIKPAFLVIFCLLLAYIAAEDKYVYAETSFNELNIPFASKLTFKNYNPGVTAGFGFPLYKGKIFYLFNKNEAGWNKLSRYQDKVHIASIFAPEWHLLPWLDIWAGAGGGASLLLQNSVYSIKDGGKYMSTYPIFSIEGILQTGVRFSIPGVKQLHLYAEYEIQVSYFGLTCPVAQIPVYPVSAITAGLLWKFGDKK